MAKKVYPTKKGMRKVPGTDDQPMQIVCAECTTPDTCKAQNRCRKTGRRLDTI